MSMHSPLPKNQCVMWLSVLFCAGCSDASDAFRKLQRVRRDTPAARPLAERLMQTEARLQLALDDFHCFGDH